MKILQYDPAPLPLTFLRNEMMSFNTLMGSVGLGLMLVACGGGGGGKVASPSNTPTLAISAANQDKVSVEVVSSTIGSASPSSATGAEVTAITDVAISKRVKSDVQDFLNRVKVKGDEVATGGSYTEAPRYCAYGGTKTYSGYYASSSTVTVGDYDTATYSNCKLTATSTVNGSLTLTATAYSSSSSNVYNVGISMQYSNYSITVTSGSSVLTASQNGTLSASINKTSATDDTFTMTTPSYVVTATYNGTTASRTLSDFTLAVATTQPSGIKTERYTSSGSLVSSAFASSGRVSFTTSTPFVLFPNTETYAHSGVMLINGATGVLRATALDNTNVKLELDANNDGAYESSKTVTWASLQ